jgi:hypothetical protein
MTDGTDESYNEEFIVNGTRGHAPLIYEQEAIHAIGTYPGPV